MSTVKKLCLSAVCLALCCALPPAFHALGAGAAFSPIHFPVLLCGLVCGWPYGLACGVAGPILSCLISGMPGPAQLLNMVPELAVYGLLTGLTFSLVRTGKTAADLYISLVPAMLVGRVVGGLAHALVFLSGGPEYTVQMWVAGSFVKTLPGIIAQLVIIPILYLALEKAGTFPVRYGERVYK